MFLKFGNNCYWKMSLCGCFWINLELSSFDQARFLQISKKRGTFITLSNIQDGASCQNNWRLIFFHFLNFCQGSEYASEYYTHYLSKHKQKTCTFHFQLWVKSFHLDETSHLSEISPQWCISLYKIKSFIWEWIHPTQVSRAPSFYWAVPPRQDCSFSFDLVCFYNYSMKECYSS